MIDWQKIEKWFMAILRLGDRNDQLILFDLKYRNIEIIKKKNFIVVAYAAELSAFDIVDRQSWGAQPPKTVQNINHVVPFVVIHHSYIPKACYTSAKCKAAMRSMQSFHQNERRWADIGYKYLLFDFFKLNKHHSDQISHCQYYSFAVGGDGLVYEGRGFNVVGAHAPLYNNKSIGICLIGDWQGKSSCKLL